MRDYEAIWMLGSCKEDWLLSIKSKLEEQGCLLIMKKERILEEVINKLYVSMVKTLTLLGWIYEVA